VNYSKTTRQKYFAIGLLLLAISGAYLISSSQTRERMIGKMKAEPATAEVVKVDVDLVTFDALVLQKNTARVVGDLTKDDFVLFEDNVKQQLTHFSQDSLPLSVLLLIDRGGCLDPFGTEVRAAALDAVSRLKPVDEVAVMTYHDTTRLVQRFTRNRTAIAEAVSRVEEHDERANHCLNRAFYDAADYMIKASNPTGRRVIVVITGVTRNFDCRDAPSGKAAMQAVFESGSVVCGVIPKTPDQKVENGMMTWATRIGSLAHTPTLSIDKLAEETGGEVLEDKPERLDSTFNTLVNHLRTRYSLAFISTNKKRDGSLRKLRVEVASNAEKTKGKLVVKTRRSYVAPKS